MRFNPGKSSLWFGVFLVSVVLSFFYMRPLNSPGSPFIAGDGLGYYSFLPAQFIYGDSDLEFRWFTKAHNDNYSYSAFPNPEDNLLVKYKERKINKMYPGLSFLWMPFFFAARVIVLFTDFAGDGFSLPFQLCIGLASLVYLILGLWMLRKLILVITKNNFASVFVPVVYFYGTFIFEFGLLGNSMSHLYSFALLNTFLLFVWKHFNEHRKRLTYFLIAVLTFALAITVRPLTGLILLAVPAFIPAGYKWRSLFRERLRLTDGIILTLIIACLFYTLRILYVQTGTFFAYTYTNEHFDFGKAKFLEVLFSYHLGVFLYAPLLLLSLGGIFFLKRKLQVFIPFLFMGIVFLYSAWWYWPIAKRALVDFYQLPAICMGLLIAGREENSITVSGKTRKRVAVILALLCALYFQLKYYQIRNGILDSNNTYGEIYRRNFFKVRKSSQYPVNPEHIKRKIGFKEGFEGNFQGKTSAIRKTEGEKSLLLDSTYNFSKVGEYRVPDFFGEKGFGKLRCNFRMYAEPGLGSMQVLINIKDTLGKVITEVPMYLSAGDYWTGHWDEREFGYELVKEDMEQFRKIGPISLFFWNVDSKSSVYIDDVKFEFILTSVSLETIE